MQYREQIEQWLLAHEQEMLRDLGELVAIRSVKGEPAANAPFGQEPARALQWMLDACARYGLAVENTDWYAGSAALGEHASLGILSHLDVVPEGEGWLHDPFQMTCEGDKLIGRGTSDDKGPAIASLYALRAVKELGIPLHSGVELIFGTDEENGSSDLAYYRERHALPPMVFTPDGDYPVITLEKGMARLALTAAFTDGKSQVISLRAGEVINAVPALAEAVVKGVSIDAFLASRTVEYPGIAIGCFVDDFDCLHISVEGRSAHASTPEQGKNALTCMLELLSRVLGEGQQAQVIRELSRCFPFGETTGESCGIAASDVISGDLTLVLSVLHMNETEMTANNDVRFPVCCTGESVIRGMQEALAPISCEALLCDEPHHTDENSPFVQTLLRVYEEVTGDPGKCLAIGGGTYVHHVEGGVAFGVNFPGGDVHMHGAEEFIERRHLLLDALMMALAVTQLCAVPDES